MKKYPTAISDMTSHNIDHTNAGMPVSWLNATTSLTAPATAGVDVKRSLRMSNSAYRQLATSRSKSYPAPEMNNIGNNDRRLNDSTAGDRLYSS